MIFRIVLFLNLLCCQLHISAQSFVIKGKMTDQETGEALAFVNITYDSGRKGTISNIDGLFVIETLQPLKQLTFNYLGYELKTITLSPESYQHNLYIKLTRKDVEIPEVIVIPGINPANRIINRVLKNRDRNNPEKMRSFSYTSYNKMYFTLQEDTTLKRIRPPLYIDTLLRDSSEIRMNDLLRKQHLLLTEFISERNFEHPDKNNEKVTSSRVSGLTDPSFTLLATQMQSFSFYNDFVTLFDKKYLNPISPGSTSKYLFQLEDTFITETFDTLFVISFRPHRGTNFDGLKGMLYINTNGYAIQNVVAGQAKTDKHYNIRIQQRYELIDHTQWFPTQLNTDVLFKYLKLKSRTRVLYPLGIGKSYISNIRINPDLSGQKFTNIELQVNNDANKKDDTFWNNYRPIPLNAQDSATYRIIDSLGRAQRLAQTLKSLEVLTSGYIPITIFNLDFRRVINYDPYEGIRLGMGLATNQKIASFFSLGGYFSYGFKDKDWKYGSFIELFPHWQSDTRLTLQYNKDVSETGEYTFLEDQILNSSEWFRKLLIDQMYLIEEYQAAFSFRALRYFKLNLYLNQSRKQMSDYAYVPENPDYKGLTNDFRFIEAGINVKFGFKEKFMKAPSGKLLSLGTNYPMVWFNLKRGLNLFNGNFEYAKYELKITKSISTRQFGKSQITIVAGQAKGGIPLCNLYNGNGSYAGFTIEAENSFATMRMNEFYSSEFASLFVKQDFGSLLFSRPKFRPEVCLITDIGFGRMKNQQDHQQLSFNTLEKGYYESGFLVNKLLNQGFLGYGFGVFYRYGPYTYTKIARNFAYKLTLSINL